VSLGTVAVISGLVLALGLAVGGLSGFVGGRFDQVVMRICDVFLTFPTFVLAMFMVGVLGTGMVNVIVAIVLSHWAWYARIVRSLTLSVASRDFVLASLVAGASDLRIFGEHVLPGVLAQILVLSTLDIGHMMLHVSGLSFLGLGIAPPTAEWGVMINDAREYVWTQPLLILWPGLAVFLTVMAFNRIGDALRDRLDPAIAAECC
jgi:nickel transport system permease protein